MIGWLAEHHQVASVITSILLMLVWVIYLNLFFFNMVRTRRPMILISRGAGRGPEARLYVSNMGAEPIYVTAIIADVEMAEGKATAHITANDHIQTADMGPGDATNEGPLGSGAYLDAGSFESLIDRIERHSDSPVDGGAIEKITLTVVASTGYSALISAGRKTYRVLRRQGGTVFHPEAISTEQLRSRGSRRTIRNRLEQQLAAEAERIDTGG